MTARALAAAAIVATAAPASAAKKPIPPGEHVDVSRASVVELMRLPSVGRKKAEAIVAHRSRTPFHRLEDLLAVKGVSPAWLERNRQHLTLGTAPQAAPPGTPAPTRGAPAQTPARGAAPASHGR